MKSNDPPQSKKRKLYDVDTERITKVAKTITEDDLPDFMSRWEDTPTSKSDLLLNWMKKLRDSLLELTGKTQEIKTLMQAMRKEAARDLFSHMRVRQIAINQLALANPILGGALREFYLSSLQHRKTHLNSREQQFVLLEEELYRHDAALELAHIKAFEINKLLEARIDHLVNGGSPGAQLDCDIEFNAKLLSWESNPVAITHEDRLLDEHAENSQTFAIFSKFPGELRVAIWQAALPGPRILTQHSKHNKSLALLATCRESRTVTKSLYRPVLSPKPLFPACRTPLLYAGDDDTVVRNLDARGHSLFKLDGPDLILECYHMFTGLSHIKHLALAFDLLRQNGGVLFSCVQACCPVLETLTLFPSSQLEPLTSHNPKLRFIDVDSNLTNFVEFRRTNLSAEDDHAYTRILRRKALRGVSVIDALSSHGVQYQNVFPEYLRIFGQQWNPVIKICLLASWTQGWQTLPLKGDEYSRLFPGYDGKKYLGFVESGLVGDENGLFSRYDGISRLFGDQ